MAVGVGYGWSLLILDSDRLWGVGADPTPCKEIYNESASDVPRLNPTPLPHRPSPTRQPRSRPTSPSDERARNQRIDTKHGRGDLAFWRCTPRGGSEEAAPVINLLHDDDTVGNPFRYSFLVIWTRFLCGSEKLSDERYF